MASINDLYYRMSVTLISISSSGGTVLIPPEAEVIGRKIYPVGGTIFVLGSSLAAADITLSYGIPLLAANINFEVKGPAAFILLASANTSSCKVVNFLSQPGRGNTGVVR